MSGPFPGQGTKRVSKKILSPGEGKGFKWRHDLTGRYAARQETAPFLNTHPRHTPGHSSRIPINYEYLGCTMGHVPLKTGKKDAAHRKI